MSNLYINGLECETHEQLSLHEFLEWLAKHRIRTLSPKGQKRIVLVEYNDPIAKGVVFTDTDQQSFLTVSFEAGRIVAKVEDIEGNQNRFDYSFFRINSRSQRGLFTQYQGSGGVGTLRWIMGALYREHKDQKKRDLLKSDDDQAAKSIKSGKLLMHPLAPNHNFESELSKLTTVNSFQFKVPKASYFKDGRIRKFVETSDYKLKFVRDAGVLSEIRDWILDKVTSDSIVDGKVEGKDSQNNPKEIPINPDALAFDKMPLKRATTQENFQSESLLSGPLMQELEKTMGSVPSLFEKQL